MRTSFVFSHISRKRASCKSCFRSNCSIHASKSKGAMEVLDYDFDSEGDLKAVASVTLGQHLDASPAWLYLSAIESIIGNTRSRFGSQHTWDIICSLTASFAPTRPTVHHAFMSALSPGRDLDPFPSPPCFFYLPTFQGRLQVIARITMAAG